MANICLTCGDRGISDALIFCNKCEVYSVHLYCLPEIPSDFDDVVWLCEDCESDARKLFSLDKCSDSESFGSVQEKDEKRGKQVFLEGAASLKTKVTESDGQAIILSEIDCCKDAENQQMVITHSPDIVEENYVPAQPIEQPIWRGHFSISDKHIDGMLGLVAHLSNLACPKVGEEAKSLPLLLSSELLPRPTLWPKSFAKWGPSDDSIALYFFPDSESSERVFDSLVNDMINRDLGLRVVVQNAELLIFTSRLMPMEYWRFQAKFYLWGVFKAKRSRRSATNAVPREGKGVVKVLDRQSPISPLCNGSNGFGSPLSSLSQSMLR